MNTRTMYTLSYGLFVLSTQLEGRDNGCIINTGCQVTGNPLRLTIAVDKSDYTEELLQKSKVFNLSVLDESAPFSLFQHFGFQSGRDVDKLADFPVKRSENGLFYVPDHTAAFISCKVEQMIDLGSHNLYIAAVTDGEMLSDKPSMTYAYYHKNVKPRPQKTEKKGWRCKICGYIYEGDELPEDFICPVCKHPASDFERI